MDASEIVANLKRSILDLNKKTYGGYSIAEKHAEERARNIAVWVLGEIADSAASTKISELARMSRALSDALHENHEDYACSRKDLACVADDGVPMEHYCDPCWALHNAMSLEVVLERLDMNAKAKRAEKRKRDPEKLISACCEATVHQCATGDTGCLHCDVCGGDV